MSKKLKNFVDDCEANKIYQGMVWSTDDKVVVTFFKEFVEKNLIVIEGELKTSIGNLKFKMTPKDFKTSRQSSAIKKCLSHDHKNIRHIGYAFSWLKGLFDKKIGLIQLIIIKEEDGSKNEKMPLKKIFFQLLEGARSFHRAGFNCFGISSDWVSWLPGGELLFNDISRVTSVNNFKPYLHWVPFDSLPLYLYNFL